MSKHPVFTRAGDTTTTIRDWTVTIAALAIGLALVVNCLGAVLESIIN